jgi:hypothetical protein
MPMVEVPAKLPGGEPVRYDGVRTMTIVGANGTGKTRIGAYIEKAAGVKAHRLSAQRALSIPLFVQPRAYEQAESTLLNGNYDPGQKQEQRDARRFKTRWGDDPYAKMLSDYEHLLALLFADEEKRNREYTNRALYVEVPTQKPPKCKLDRLRAIWAAVMPQRGLIIGDNKISATMPDGGSYEARHMSDGERVCLYLAGNALCAPADGVIVIDEPEIHVHRAIQPLLWDQIEQARPDCAFVYITHDLDFAATRVGARRVWLREYDGKDWVWEEVDTSTVLPDALMLQVLGNRRPVLFVEGDGTSYDEGVYSALYPDRHVVPCASGEKVVEATKALKGLPALHRLEVRGLVDRDRRGTEEIAALQAAGVLVADVAEVENLFCLPEVIEAVIKATKSDDLAGTKSAAERAVLTELTRQIEHQALSRALAEVQFRMNGFGPKIGKTDAAQLEAEMNNYVRGIDVPATVARCRALFREVLDKMDYRGALRYFNCKGTISFVARALGMQESLYGQLVRGLLKENPKGAVAEAMRAAVEGDDGECKTKSDGSPEAVCQAGRAASQTPAA